MSPCERWVQASLPLEATVMAHAAREAQRRAAELRLDEAAFVERLQSDREEVERLVRTVVPPETWLFRHVAAFELVRAWLQARPGMRVRMLSLGCARGAEPFSLAATAASVGRSEADTEIVGVDWCEANLREAASGTCSPLAQRGPLPEWAQAWFTPDARGALRVDTAAQRMIRWVHADIVRDPLPGVAHIVMCRNVAIYLGEPARGELARRLDGATEPDGLLFVGHADPTCLWEGAFSASEEPASFGHRRREAPAAKAPTPKVTPTRARTPVAPVPARRPPASTPPNGAAESFAKMPALPAEATLEQAQHFADAGRLPESAALLERALEADPLRADGWSLLGAVRLAQHRASEAEACFRKVVYLHPNDALCLLQLSALSEARGDHAAADRLRLRAARAASGATE